MKLKIKWKALLQKIRIPAIVYLLGLIDMIWDLIQKITENMGSLHVGSDFNWFEFIIRSITLIALGILIQWMREMKKEISDIRLRNKFLEYSLKKEKMPMPPYGVYFSKKEMERLLELQVLFGPKQIVK